MNKRWLVVPITLAVLAIGGVTAGATLAQGSGTEGDSAISSFASRVAQILGLDEVRVQDAMEQASQELQDEAIKSNLDALVQQGRMTQEQADQYLEWYQARPDGLPGFGGPGFGLVRHYHGHGFMGFRGPGEIPHIPPAAVTPTPDASPS